jgi:hypothetical protein
MMKFPNFGQRRSNQSSIHNVSNTDSNAEAPIQPEETLEDEMAGLSAEEAAEIRDAFDVILHSDQAEDPMSETAMDVEGELAAEPEWLAVAQAKPAESELNATSSLMAKLDLDITPLVVPTIIAEPIEFLNPYNLSQDLGLMEDPLAAEGLDLEITLDPTDRINNSEAGETEAVALEESSYDIHTDGPLTYFQYYLDGESGEAAEYNPVSLRRPSIPTGLVGAGILGAALISGFSIADAMKQGQPVAKRPNPSPLQDLKIQATPPPVIPVAPESLQPEISALPPQVNRAALGAGPVGAANLPIVSPPGPAMNAISQPTYSLQQVGGAVASIAPISSQPKPQEPPAPISEIQPPAAPVNSSPAPNPQILPPPPLPSGILSEPQPVVVSSIPDPVATAPEVNLPAQSGATNLQPLQSVTPEVISTAPETSQPKVAPPQNLGILPRPGLPSPGPAPAKLPEVLPINDRLSSATTGVKETLVKETLVKETLAPDNELVFDRKPMPPGSIESPQAAVTEPTQVSGALQILLTPPQNKGFLADDATLRSLSQQEATMLTQAIGIAPFTKQTLAIRDYARAYQVASKQVNGLPPFGFINYQQKTIILPDESSTVSSTAPTNPQS